MKNSLIASIFFIPLAYTVLMLSGCEQQRQVEPPRETTSNNSIEIDVTHNDLERTITVKSKVKLDARSKREALLMTAQMLQAQANAYKDEPRMEILPLPEKPIEPTPLAKDGAK